MKRLTLLILFTIPFIFLTGQEFDTITDARDGKQYRIVKIGNHWWMAENLAFLPEVYPSATESNVIPYYYVYDYQGTDINAAKATDNYDTYGVLYNWPAASDACPTGWHLPSIVEWDTLENTLGTSAGGKLKESGLTHWADPNSCATNESGFTGLPAGYKHSAGVFSHMSTHADFWTSIAGDVSAAWRGLLYDGCGISKSTISRQNGFSVRCVKNLTLADGGEDLGYFVLLLSCR